MPYRPPVRASFNLSSDSYLPTTEFAFYAQPLVAFLPSPSLVNAYSAFWEAGSAIQKNTRSDVINASKINRPCRIENKKASNQSLVIGLTWGTLIYQEVTVESVYGEGCVRLGNAESHWRSTKERESSRSTCWVENNNSIDQKNKQPWQLPPSKQAQKTERFYRVDELTAAVDRTQSGYQLPTSSLLEFNFRHLRYSPLSAPSVYFQFITRRPKQAIRPKDSRLTQAFVSHQQQDQPIKIVWGLGRKATDESISTRYGDKSEPKPEKPKPKQPDIRETYLLMNTINVVVLPDRIPLEMRELDISLDIDSFAWSFRGELWGASSLALVEPDHNGTKQIEVDINGWQWLFMIERYDADRAFNREHYTVYGTSRTSLLAAPYAPLRSKSSSTSINAKQAATEELTNTGFTLNWPTTGNYTTPDWIIPGNTYSYQNQTAMQVIARIATTAGAVVIPDKNADTLTIQPRYPTSSWGWPETTMDKIIPASMVISLSASWQPEAEYNAVYVSGIYEGVSVNVKRKGTAGDNPAPDIFEDWLTETQVNTERGRNELSKGGNQSITTIELPLTDRETAPGLIEPGKLVEVQDTLHGASGNWQALCLSTLIKAVGGAGKVTQVITLERHYE